MTDADLVRRFFAPVCLDDRTVIALSTISWPHPLTPESTWGTVAELPPGALQDEIDREIRKILRDKRYFRICQQCRQRNPVGWMHDERICQGCAQMGGVVY